MATGMKSTCNILRAVTKYGMPVTSVRWKWHRSWRLSVPSVPCIRQLYPQILRFTVDGAEVLMKHIGGYPGNYDPSIKGSILVRPPKLFISGHSHILKVKYDKTLDVLHINPGAAGIQGFHKVRTMVRFAVDGGTFKDLEVIELADR